MKRTNRHSARNSHTRVCRGLMFERLESRELFAATAQDFLFVGDAANNSVQKFDAATGAYVSAFVAPGSSGLLGPRGLVLDRGNLLVVNQNVDLTKNGEVLRFNAQTGSASTPLVAASNPSAPFSPAGIVVRDNVAYVADTRDNSLSGRIAKYDATTGAFLADLVPNNFSGEFRPRGLVFGPDGGLYVSVSSKSETDNADPPGEIIRFDVTTGSSRVVAWNDGDGVDESAQGEAHNLHNPLGIVFSPNGTLYVTSNRKQAGTSAPENTKIVMIDPADGKELDHIELAPQPSKFPTRHIAQSIIFGPDDKLYIPILVDSLTDSFDSAAILTYDPATKQSKAFFLSSPFEQTIDFPLFVTFGKTDPATLAYLDATLDSSPVLSGVESVPLSHDVQDSPVKVSSTISIRDRDSNQLSSATIRISQNYQKGFDTLTFTNTTSLQGSWIPATGTLTLVGNASLATYESALRSIQFQHTSANPVAGMRAIEFQVSDGQHSSNVQTRSINLTLAANDFLYVGDQGDPADPSDDRVKKFDLRTGNLVSSLGTPVQLNGPRGMVVSNGKLLVVNQNVEQPTNGEVLRFDLQSGSPVEPLVSSHHPKAPLAPRGLVAKDNVLYIADAEGSSRFGSSFPPINAYNATTGDFLSEIIPNACFASEIHPRGLVFGPDGMLYASYFSTSQFATTDAPGVVLRFLDMHTGAFEVVAANYGSRATPALETETIHNPEGIAFGPDGRLYVTSFTPNSANNGIIVWDVQTKTQFGFIPLGQDSAQSLLFGPNDRMYVPVTSGSGKSGSIRVYEPSTGSFTLLVTSLSGNLKQPWYSTFSHTNAATLAYQTGTTN